MKNVLPIVSTFIGFTANWLKWRWCVLLRRTFDLSAMFNALRRPEGGGGGWIPPAVFPQKIYRLA